MHTIKLNVPDNLYPKLLNSKIDIQLQFEEFLHELFDDGYPSISSDEAKERVSDLVLKYKKGELKTIPYEEDMDKIDNWLKTI